MGFVEEQCVPGIVDHGHFSPFLHPHNASFKCTTAVTTHKALDKKEFQGQSLRFVSFMSPAGLYCCYAVIIVLTGALIALSIVLSLSVRKEEKAIASPEAGYATCPRDWIAFGSKCFYFSEHTSNWTSSQTSCMELGAHLTHFDSLEELNFLNRLKGDSAAWIGLHRESSEQPWMWTDNTEYNNLIPIRGEGEHAYLSDNGISSGRDYTHRKWICSKPYSYALQCPVISQLV
ncbi:C-type lectin domain family 2 member E-like [Chionomys nivalis]|uniref:C-type lectin domain family 2 member E-like n=1 Tax=Chionomys nivalis TaxID=269649 RepID=UPI002596C03A|nr:C-type lectin domain family 2 member E-like [Chionomys nivalis]